MMRRKGLPAGFFAFADGFFASGAGVALGAEASVVGSFVGVLIVSHPSEGQFGGDFDQMKAASADDDAQSEIFGEAF